MRDLVAVIGTTGVGKSDLAVSLAQAVQQAGQKPTDGALGRQSGGARMGGYSDALVLSADSMQLYQGLDVITNKMTREEMGGVRHWGLDVVKPGEPSWELGKWCTEADKQIDALPASSLPIVCGGTHYFVQHFLFPPPELSLSRLGTGDKGKGPDMQGSTSRAWQPPCDLPPTPELSGRPDLLALLETFWTPKPVWPSTNNPDADERYQRVTAGSSSAPDERNAAANWTDDQLLSLHTLLSALDSKEAQRWHWRDGRKVKRSIERWWEAQAKARAPGAAEALGHEPMGGSPGRRARFRTLIFWVYEDMELLKPRLDRRVDRMVQNGLLREIAELRGVAAALYGSPDRTDHAEGIFQSIGYKEFAAFSLEQPDPTSDPSFANMLDRMKISTRQYAKSQIKWIKKQLLPAIREARGLGGEVGVYVVPGGPPGQEVARGVLERFLRGKDLPQPDYIHEIGDLLDVLNGEDARSRRHGHLIRVLSRSSADVQSRQSINARQDCDVCSSPGQPCSISVKEWGVHIRSKGHKRNARLANEDKASMIARLKAEGQARKAERDAQAASLPPQLGRKR